MIRSVAILILLMVWCPSVGGVLTRRGHTEAALDLAVLAGLPPAGVLCEVVNDDDGSMARLPYLKKFAKEHGILLISIDELVKYCSFPCSSLPHSAKLEYKLRGFINLLK